MATIQRIPCGNVNCYLLREGNQAILVDTGRTKHRDKVLAACRDVTVNLIFLTHGHIDHVQNAAFLSEKLGAPIAMHRADVPLIEDNMRQPLQAHSPLGKLVLAFSLRSFQRDSLPAFAPAVLLDEGDSLLDYGFSAVVAALPGHTNGSIGLLVNGTDLLVGDALMHMGFPSRSLLYTDRTQMDASAKKISQSGATTIYFGHGSPIANRTW